MDERVSILRLWTTRYLITLFIGLIIIGIFSSYWLQYSATVKRLDIMKMLAEEIADRVVDTEGKIYITPFLSRILDRREQFLQLDTKPLLLIIDENDRPIYTWPSVFPLEFLYQISFLLNDGNSVNELTLQKGDRYYLVKKQLVFNDENIGWVLLIHPKKDLTRNPEELQLLVIMLGSLGLLGWGVIYILTRKLSKPIKDVGFAAKQIVAGDYTLHLNKNIKEKEIYELIQSFKDMADRLQKLETMRTELLAGVTHELKTPVTSISGLLQAVKDEVVTGEEAKEFLDICSKETYRLQNMVEDLLDFNSFAVGAIKVQKETHNINRLIQEIIHQWRIVQEEDTVSFLSNLSEHDLYLETDALRIQQILINLFNNAKQAVDANGQIEVSLSKKEDEIKIDVKDNGIGIPEKEQHLIFERFFRGEDKKNKIRGLGLGLTFSKIIAKALGGDLELKESTKEGTTFSLILR